MLDGDQISPRLSADSTGTQTGEQGHYPFGGTWYETGASTKFKFTSYEREAGAQPPGDLDYAVYRSHYPRLGRFTSPDPVAGSIVDPQSLNRYAYSRNDPVNLTDPLGLDPVKPWRCYNEITRTWELCGGVGGGGGGGGVSSSGLDAGWWWSFFDASNPVGVQSVLDFGGAMAHAATRSALGYDWYNLPGNWSVAAEEERHQSIITTGWDPELKCLRGVTCGGKGSTTDSDQARRNCIERALEEAFGVEFEHVTDTGTRGGHLNATFQTSDHLTVSPSRNQGVPPGSRINTSYEALHVPDPNASVPVADNMSQVTAHVDLANPNNGLLGILGHIFGDVVAGNTAQLFGGNIDKECQ